MQLEEYLDLISSEVIRLKGHRIGIEDVVARYHRGESIEQMALEFPGVPLEQLYATIAYYLHNRAAVDAYIEQISTIYRARMQADDAQPASPLMQRLRARRACSARIWTVTATIPALPASACPSSSAPCAMRQLL